MYGKTTLQGLEGGTVMLREWLQGMITQHGLSDCKLTCPLGCRLRHYHIGPSPKRTPAGKALQVLSGMTAMVALTLPAEEPSRAAQHRYQQGSLYTRLDLPPCRYFSSKFGKLPLT